MKTELRNTAVDVPIDSFLTIRREGKWIHQVRLGSVSRIGRDADNHICLSSNSVSRSHCVIRWQDGRWQLTDLNSSNGTILNGQRVDRTTIVSDRDVLCVGDFELTAELSAAGETRQAPQTHETLDPDIDREAVLLETISKSGYFRQSEVLGSDVSVPGTYAALYRLSMRLASINDSTVQANLTLQELLATTKTGFGSILLRERGVLKQQPANLNQFSTVAFASTESDVYKPSRYISNLVIDGGEGILAIEIGCREQFDSAKAIGAESVICVPIRFNEQLYGLIHIYCREIGRAHV